MREGRAGTYSIDAVWLVKSGDRILGPFSVNEISSKLRNKEIVVIDEVTRPFSRWRVIRDEPEFAAVVEEIRKGQMSGREDTEIQGHTLGAQTLSTDEFSVATDPNANSTEAIQMPFDSSRVQDAEFTESPSDRKVTIDKPREFKRAAHLPQFGVGQESSASDKARSNRLSSAAWIVTGCALVIALFIYLRGQTPGTAEPNAALNGENLNTVMNDADASWRKGDFVGALNWYRVANRMKPKNPEVMSRLGPLIIALEGQTVQAKRGLIDALAMLPPTGENGLHAELETGIGLSSLVAEDLTEADAHFRLALALQPTSFPAQFNSAMVTYLQKSYTEAARRFSASSEEPASLLMAARSQIASGKTSRSDGTANALERMVATFQDFRQEALVVSAYSELQSGNKKKAASQMLTALEIDPELTTDHWHDPALYLEPLSWRTLTPFCRSLNEEFNSASSRALFGLCLFKGGKREEANDTLSDALSRAPQDALLRSVAAYILAGSERTDEARAAIQLASIADAPRLTMILRGRMCEQTGDDACAEKSWTALSNTNPPTLAALTGLAKLRLKAGDRAGAKQFLERAKAISARYKPALAIKIDGSTK